MVKAIGAILCVLFVFSLSAAASWFLLQQRSAAAHAPIAIGDANAANALMPPDAASNANHLGMATGELPVPVHGPAVSPEEVFRYSLSLRNREKTLKSQQESVERQQTQLKLVQEDIRGDQKKADAMLTRIRDDIAAAEKLLANLQEQRQQLQQEQEKAKDHLQQFKKAQVEFKGKELENIKQMSEWVEGMSPEKAAEYLRELSNDGKMETAISLLGHFDGRKASKILDAMNDPGLVVQLTEKFKEFEKPKPETKRR